MESFSVKNYSQLIKTQAGFWMSTANDKKKYTFFIFYQDFTLPQKLHKFFKWSETGLKADVQKESWSGLN